MSILEVIFGTSVPLNGHVQGYGISVLFLDTFLERPFADLGSQGYPKGNAFGPIFLTFGGPGAFAEIAVLPRQNIT